MKVQIECTYCGHKWTETVYQKSSVENMTCIWGNCKDSNLIVRDMSVGKIDYYAGSPPFPEDNWPLGKLDYDYMGKI